jgi:hypothetical protein
MKTTKTIQVERLEYLPCSENDSYIVNMAILNIVNGQYVANDGMFLTPSKYLIPFSLKIYKNDINICLNAVKLFTKKWRLIVSHAGGCDCIIEGYILPKNKQSLMEMSIFHYNQHCINDATINCTQVFKSFHRICGINRLRQQREMPVNIPLLERFKSFKKNNSKYIQFSMKKNINI